MVRYPGYQMRLREGGLVTFVVPPAPVTNQIYQKILMKSGSVGVRESDGGEAGPRIISVYMDDWYLEALGHVAGVERRASILGLSREANLIVEDDMDGATGLVTGESREVECLGNDALSRKSGVAMDRHRQRQADLLGGRAGMCAILLGGTCRTGNNWIHEFEVTGIMGQRQLELHQLRFLQDSLRTQVIFHIAGPAKINAFRPFRRNHLFVGCCMELGENSGDRFLEDMGEHIQAPSMRHADDDLPGAGHRRRQEQGIQHGNEHVQTFKREPLLPRESGLEEFLEAFDLAQAFKEAPAVFGRKWLVVDLRLDRFIQPESLIVAIDVVELITERAAIESAQAGDSAQTVNVGGLWPDDRSRQGGKVGVVQLMSSRHEHRISGAITSEGVYSSGQMPIFPYAACQASGSHDASHSAGGVSSWRGLIH